MPFYDYYDYGQGYYYDDSATTYSDVSADVTFVAQVQAALASAGYYHESIDGIMGDGTRSAIAAYQRDYGLPVTGLIDTALLESLGLA